ncbi:hypothetical protein VSY18_22815 [Bacillus albus]|uniref:hypothetical protein n=1 Tax=Bacillus TaxID=1386 RepID=UPI0020012C32|nr:MULTISPECIES: hypothetical protein [Bacillus]MDA2025024.1 hypothetical protein [Bacillus cereus group sp. Bcc03]MDA2214769.1 hypothetical protein [Bacillus cereus group sp. Bc228]MDA2226725.1 hypothetical protein [Bacillus cereus group sp. Bc227]MDA2259096.1 hypothetical protein [Bacillus cereus group sp. Bc200]MDA2325080.1 hypothetical protein [Bacillus cereus group sp. Bc177]
MKELRKLKKEELIELLVGEYGYEKEDLKGKVNIELKEIIMKEEEFSKKEEKKKTGISTFDDDYLVLVMNNTAGKVSYSSDISHDSYVWTGYGDTQHMPYRELSEIKRRYPRYLNEGWLMIRDKDVRKLLCDDDSVFIEPNELERVFSLPTNKMLDEIRKYKGSAYQVLGKTVYNRCKSGVITDFSKFRALIAEFRFDMEEFMQES